MPPPPQQGSEIVGYIPKSVNCSFAHLPQRITQGEQERHPRQMGLRIVPAAYLDLWIHISCDPQDKSAMVIRNGMKACGNSSDNGLYSAATPTTPPRMWEVVNP